MLSSTPGFYPLDASSKPLVVATKNVSNPKGKLLLLHLHSLPKPFSPDSLPQRLSQCQRVLQENGAECGRNLSPV